MTAEAEGSTYYVSAVTGSDDNVGTLQNPFKTIQKAANVAEPGDTVEIMAGVYHETVMSAISGTSDAAITYTNCNNEEVTITGADPVTGWTVTGETNIWKGAEEFQGLPLQHYHQK